MNRALGRLSRVPRQSLAVSGCLPRVAFARARDIHQCLNRRLRFGMPSCGDEGGSFQNHGQFFRSDLGALRERRFSPGEADLKHWMGYCFGGFALLRVAHCPHQVTGYSSQKDKKTAWATLCPNSASKKGLHCLCAAKARLKSPQLSVAMFVVWHDGGMTLP